MAGAENDDEEYNAACTERYLREVGEEDPKGKLTADEPSIIVDTPEKLLHDITWAKGNGENVRPLAVLELLERTATLLQLHDTRLQALYNEVRAMRSHSHEGGKR